MKKRVTTLILTFALVLSTLLTTALGAEKQTYTTGSPAAGEYFNLTLEGTKLTLECRLGDQILDYPFVYFDLYYWSETNQGYGAGEDNVQVDYGDESVEYLYDREFDERDHTVTWQVRPSDHTIKLRVLASNMEGYGKTLLEVKLEYNDGAPRFGGAGAAPVLAQNQERSTRWVNIDRVDIHPEVRAKSDEICAGLDSDMDKLRAIHDWVCTNIYYDMDNYSGAVVPMPEDMTDSSLFHYQARGVLKNRRAVCMGYAELTRHLLQAQNIPCITVTGYALGLGAPSNWTESLLANTETSNHDWNEVWVDGRWVIVDTTWDAGGSYGAGQFRDGSMRYAYFDPSLESYSADHRTVERGGAHGDLEPSAWAKEEIAQGMRELLYPSNLSSNYKRAITRQDFCIQMIALIEKGAGMPIQAYLASKGLTTDPTVFSDVLLDSKVLAAYALGIVKGKTGGPAGGLWFDPFGDITRQEAAVMLTNCAKLLGAQGGTPRTFGDHGQIAGWAKESVSYVSSLSVDNKSVMGDSGGGLFRPAGTYTYEEAMVSALRLLRCVSPK